MKSQAAPTPNTSPATTQKAFTPRAAPIPVRPSSSQADSPVARAEKATDQKLSFLPAA